MQIAHTAYKTFFDDFEIEEIIDDPHFNYLLFEENISDKQSEQLKVFNRLEADLPLFDGSSFGNQVHFQNAFRTPNTKMVSLP